MNNLNTAVLQNHFRKKYIQGGSRPTLQNTKTKYKTKTCRKLQNPMQSLWSDLLAPDK